MKEPNLPKIKQSVPVIISNSEIDKALTKNLDQEGLLRLKSVDQAVAFCMDKEPTVAEFQKIYETIYKFYNNERKQSDTPGESR
jgi:hypothetical protein